MILIRNNNLISKFADLFKLCAFPMSICHPIPFIVLLVFSQAGGDIFSLLFCIGFTLAYMSAVNLWNHYNDIVEDILAGRKTILTEDENFRRLACILAVALYAISFVIVYLQSNVLLFLPSAISTWLYSDRTILGERRLKNYYVTEVLAYVFAVPFYVLTLWAFFSPVTMKAILLALSITFLLLSGTFLKDLKDYTGDSSAGLRTLAVVCSPSLLLKLHYAMVWLYYLSIVFGVLIQLYPTTAIVSLVPSIATARSFLAMHRAGWCLNVENVELLKIEIASILISIILFILSGFLSQA